MRAPASVECSLGREYRSLNGDVTRFFGRRSEGQTRIVEPYRNQFQRQCSVGAATWGAKCRVKYRGLHWAASLIPRKLGYRGAIHVFFSLKILDATSLRSLPHAPVYIGDYSLAPVDRNRMNSVRTCPWLKMAVLGDPTLSMQVPRGCGESGAPFRSRAGCESCEASQRRPGNLSTKMRGTQGQVGAGQGQVEAQVTEACHR